jgi:hypothetical protein
MEAAVIDFGPNERVGHTRDLDSDIRLALSVCAARIAPHIAFELGPETVFAHAHSHVRSHPKGCTKPHVAAFRKS